MKGLLKQIGCISLGLLIWGQGIAKEEETSASAVEKIQVSERGSDRINERKDNKSANSNTDSTDLSQIQDVRKITNPSERYKARVAILKRLKSNQMIVYKPKETKAVATVFTDMDCGYCAKLHQEFDKLLDSGIELHIMAYPRHGIGSSSYNRWVSISCAKDPKETMARAMEGGNIPSKTCHNTVAEQLMLGRKLGVTGTPTIIFEDGNLSGGYLSAEKLAREAIKHTLKE
jgi:thiol:disulfide interchange protein DsbC